jgi:hypothetical protein
VDWDRLPPETQPIARLIASGFQQKEIARELGLEYASVQLLADRLRLVIVAQGLERVDELGAVLRAELEARRDQAAARKHATPRP